ncbi:MAG: hypothetical protein JST54_05040 [Deltaproteobacteria bacterium]|nr:hypothetical protein [Deltaproteobacteria bacterium]
MTFSYYARLSPSAQAAYRQSDAVHALRLPPPDARALQPLIAELQHALSRDDAQAVEALGEALCFGLAHALGAEPPHFVLLEERPRAERMELHGLYTRDRDDATVAVWMRTARHGRVVAFRTFLRTLLHEMVHHLDFVHLRLPESMHTEGFFMRITSLFHQLVPAAR